MSTIKNVFEFQTFWSCSHCLCSILRTHNRYLKTNANNPIPEPSAIYPWMKGYPNCRPMNTHIWRMMSPTLLSFCLQVSLISPAKTYLRRTSTKCAPKRIIWEGPEHVELLFATSIDSFMYQITLYLDIRKMKNLSVGGNLTHCVGL